MLSLMHVYMLVYLYLQLSLEFTCTLHGERQSCSVRLYKVPKGCNPTLHRPTEQVSTIYTIKSFSFLDQLFNVKLNFMCKVWKEFVKKNKGAGQWKSELNIIMDFPVCWVGNIFLSNLNCSV